MKKIAIAVLLSAVVVPAVASDMYVGVRAGQAKTSIDNVALTTDSPTGLGVLLGFSITPELAAEVEYLDLGEVKAGGGGAKSSGFSVSGIGSIPLNEQFSLFGKLGYAMLTSQTTGGNAGPDAKSNGLTYGFGAQFNISPAVGIRLGWDKYQFSDTANGMDGNADLISAGAVFKF